MAPCRDAQIYQEELELEIMRQGVIASANSASSAAGVVMVMMSVLGVPAMLRCLRSRIERGALDGIDDYSA